jgi:hypothetical protein
MTHREQVREQQHATTLEDLPRGEEELTEEQAEATLGGIWDQKTCQTRQTSVIQDL